MIKKRVVSIILAFLLVVTTLVPAMAAEVAPNLIVVPSVAPGEVELTDIGVEYAGIPVKFLNLNCATEGATIRFTFDGSDPKTSATSYTWLAEYPFEITEATTIKAYASLDGVDGDIFTFEYTIKRNDVSIDLGNPIVEDGLTLYTSNGDGQPVESVIDGVYSLRTDKENDSIFLYFDVDDTFIKGGSNEVEVEVEYYDDTIGTFGIGYDDEGVGATAGTEGVQLKGSGQWLKAVLTIPDAEFKNELNGADFRIGLYTPRMGYVGDNDVSIRSVKVRKPVQNPVNLKVISSKLGNIFTQSEQLILNLNINNTTDSDKNLQLEYTVLDRNGIKVKSDTISNIQANAGSTYPINLDLNDITKYDTYKLSVNITGIDSDVNIEGVYPFSRILSENRDVSDGIFGVCTHFAQGSGVVEGNLTVAQQAGAKYIRDEMYWSQAETVKGVVTIKPEWEDYIDTAIEKGMQPLVILSYGNPLYDEGNPPESDEAIAAYANYAKTVAQHFKGRVTDFEIWNEYNINTIANRGTEDAAIYKRMMEAAYNAIKSVYAGDEAAVTVIGAVTANNDLEWIEDLLIAGGFDYMDAISVHPYTYPFSPVTNGLDSGMVQLDALLHEYGGEHMPIWISEIGWPTNEGARGVNEYQSAIYGVQAHIITQVDNVVDKVFWYDLQNDGTDSEYTEHNFGMIRTWYDEIVPAAAKQNYIAYSALTSRLLGKTYDRSYNDLNQDIKIYRFTPETASENSADTLVVWTTGSDKNVVLDLGCTSAEVSDMFGNKNTVYAIDGKVSLTLTAAPMYIEGVMAENISMGTSALSLDAYEVDSVAGGSFSIGANYTGTVPVEGAKYKVIAPTGWNTVSDVSFSTGNTSKQIEITCPETISNGIYELYVQAAMNNDKVFAMVKVLVHIVDSYAVKVMPVPVVYGEWDKWQISTEISNNYAEDVITGAVSIVQPTEWANVVDYSIAANSTEVFNIPVPGSVDQGVYDLKMEINVNGEIKTVQKSISFLAAAETVTAPVIDGVMNSEEWEDSMAFYLNTQSQIQFIPDWAGVDDLSGTGYLKWDDEKLYLAVEVKDNVHKQAYMGGNIWNGDGIQFAIDPDRENPGSQGWNEIGISLNNDGGITKFRWSSANGKTSGDFTEMDCSIIRDDETGTIVYETSMPWGDLLPDGIAAAKGSNFGFSLLINDDDGSGRRGFIEYMGGIGVDKDASAFGDVILVSNIAEPVSSDATLKDLKVNGNIVPGFAADVYEYGITLPAGTITVPTVTATVNDSNAVATVTAAAGLPGTTTIVVTAEDGITTKTYKINFAVQSSGGGTTPTPTPAPTPKPAPTVEEDKQGNAIVKLPDPKLDATTGAAKSILDAATLDKAKEGINGNKKVIVEIPAVKNAKAYTVELPKTALTTTEAKKKERIEIQTEFGNIEVPANMFKASELTGATNVKITVGKADTSGLDKEILSQIGNKPVVELTVTADGTQIDWNNPEAPVTVSIDYTPTQEELKNPGHITVWYIDGDGKVVSIPNAKYDKKTGKVVFTTTHFSKYTVAYVEKTFSDAAKISWAQKQVEVLASKGIIDTDQADFKPETNITRGEFVSMLVKALGLSANTDVTFVDVKKGSKYFEEISTAKKLGIAAGGNKNAFRPDEEISRQDMMVLLTKALTYAGKITEDGNLIDLEKFADQAKISAYAKQSIATLVKAGIISGEGKNMNPLGNTNKAAAACVIYNLFN